MSCRPLFPENQQSLHSIGTSSPHLQVRAVTCESPFTKGPVTRSPSQGDVIPSVISTLVVEEHQKPTLRAGGQRAVRNIHTASGSSWSAVLIFDLLESSCKLSSSVPRTSQGISLYTSPSCDSCLAWRWPDVGKHHMQHGVPAHCWSWLPTVMGGGPPGARATLPISCSSSMFVHTDTSRPLGPWSPQSPPM